MALVGGDRSDAMLQRVLRTARAHGVPDTGLLEEAFRMAMAPRFKRLDDDHDPRFLHPGRTALILMDDVGETDPGALATAMLGETESPELAVDEAHAGPGSARLRVALAAARALPEMGRPGELAEALVTAPDPVATIALAEFLDQLRHLRLWADPARVRARGRVAAEVLVPMADRAHPVLARRFRWWVRRVVPTESPKETR